MAQRTLADRLSEDVDARTVSAFPDGSVDTFYAVSAAGERLETRADFADVVAAGDPEVVSLERGAVEPGGHAVNVAEQAALLGDDVTLAGHLDDPAFENFAADDRPLETVSMGEPSSVSAFGFDDGDLLAVEDSSDVEGWTLADLEDALGHALEDLLTADAVVCTNWTSIDGLPDALAALADRDLDGGWFVFDPGSVAEKGVDGVDRLFDAFERLSDGYDVVLAANRREVGSLADAIGADPDDVDESLRALRRRSDLAGAVVHHEPWAAVATADGVVGAENYDVEPVRHTGGGDRFDAGLAHALTRGWDWTSALRLGNACASRYVATGESATPEALATFVRERG